jgi:hypothetical protein
MKRRQRIPEAETGGIVAGIGMLSNLAKVATDCYAAAPLQPVTMRAANVQYLIFAHAVEGRGAKFYEGRNLWFAL